MEFCFLGVGWGGEVGWPRGKLLTHLLVIIFDPRLMAGLQQVRHHTQCSPERCCSPCSDVWQREP